MIYYMKFDMDKPDDASSFTLASHGKKYYFALRNIDNYLRSQLKYRDLSRDAEKALREAREELTKIMQDEGVSVDDVE